MLINVLYDDLFDDCDIISVPDEIGENAEQYSQMYCRWLDSDQCPEEYHIVINGNLGTICETEGFVKWINLSFGKGNIVAQIVKQHTKFVPEYPTAEF